MRKIWTLFVCLLAYTHSSGQAFERNHDGSRHHEVGVLPDVECPTRIEDVRNGKDTQLLKVCELINSGL